MVSAISIQNVHKTYANGTHALKGVSFDIAEGEFFGLLGPNGSGKSTLINIISGPTKISKGDVKVFGLDINKNVKEVKMMLGIVPQEITFDSFFNVEDILKFQSGYYGIRNNEKRIDEILEKLSLSDKKKVNNRMLSGGMKRRLLIAKALVHNPKILILDEPTAGVDVELRYGLWEYIKELNQNGLSILLTTHYLEEAETLCSKLAIINKGQVVANEPTKSLLKKMGDIKRMQILLKEGIDSIPKELKKYEASLDNPSELNLKLKAEEIMEAFERIKALDLKILDINIEGQKLEEIFINLTYRNNG